jgi:hypothetical protein
VYQNSEAATFRNKCSKYFSCPICFNIMNMTLTVNAQKQKILYYNCSYCQFNTLKLDICSDDAH